MKILLPITSALLALSVAAAATPTKESVERLLKDANVQRNLQLLLNQMDAASRNAMSQAFRGQKLTPEAQQLSQSLEAKIMADMKDELSWQKMKGLYVKVYSETFTQKEIDGLINFYESSTGKVFVAKMPVVMSKTSAMMRGRIGPMVRRLQKDVQDSVREIRAKEENTEKQSTENLPGAATPPTAGGGQAKSAGK